MNEPLLKSKRTHEFLRVDSPESALAPAASVHLRRYRAQDAAAVLKLFSDVFGKQISLDYWHWKYPENAGAQTLAHVAAAPEGEIIGFYGGMIRRFQYRGREILSSQAADVMLRSDYRGSGLFQALGEEHFRELKRLGVAMIYGFPTREHFAAGSRKLNYERIKEIPVWERGVSVKDIFSFLKRPNQEFCFSKLRRFEAGADALWERIRPAFPCSLVRDSRYLNRRYCDQPGSHVQIFLAKDRTGTPRGILAAGDSRKGKDAEVLILWEMLAAPGDRAAGQYLLERALRLAVLQGKKRLRVWSEGGQKEALWRGMGFFPARREESVFAFKSLDESVGEEFLEENFYYTLGDTDFPA